MLHGRNRPFPRSRGAPPDAPTQSETTSWQAQVVTNGGSVSAARFIIVNNFIAAEKAAGTWALTDDYWGLWAEDTIGALTSLKQRRFGGSFGAPSFVPSRGYTFDGATNYMNTLFQPATHTLTMTGTNLRIAVYERTNVNANVYAAGATDSTNAALGIRPRSGINLYVHANTSFVQFSNATADSRGLSAGSRNGADSNFVVAYKNGASVPQTAGSTSANVLPVAALYIGCNNTAGTAGSFRAASIGFACAGASLSAGQEFAQYTNVQTWATAIGAQV